MSDALLREQPSEPDVHIEGLEEGEEETMHEEGEALVQEGGEAKEQGGHM